MTGALVRIDADGTMRPRQRAATFPELTAALRQYLFVVTRMRRLVGPPAGFRYGSSEELVLFNATPVWANLRAMGLPPMPAKECFDNALSDAANPALRYTEGFALMDGGIPTHHGWVTDTDGKALDSTWPALYDRHAKAQPAKRWSGRVVYLGISVDRGAHLKWIERTGYPNLLAVNEFDVEQLLHVGLSALDLA